MRSGLGWAALMLIWYLDPLQRPAGAMRWPVPSCLAALVALALAVPNDPWEEFYAENYVSKFARSGVTAIGDLITRGVLESDATVASGSRARPARPARCTSRRTSSWCSTKSSFDARAIPG